MITETIKKLKTLYFPNYYDHLGEGAAQLDMRRRRELSPGAHGERAGLQAVKVGHDQ